MTTPAIVQTGRRLLARYRLDRCVIHDATTVRDTTGGTTTTHVARAVETPCRWGVPTDAEARAVGGTVSGRAPMVLSLGLDVSIKEGDHVANMATTPPKMHAVVANLTPSSVMATQRRVIVREL